MEVENLSVIKKIVHRICNPDQTENGQIVEQLGEWLLKFKKSDLKKNEKNQVVTKTEVKTPEPKIESTEENFDFEANANRILNASNASIEAQKATKKESAPEEKKEETKVNDSLAKSEEGVNGAKGKTSKNKKSSSSGTKEKKEEAKASS